MKIQHGQKLVLIGDSITDCGRSPAGEASPGDPLAWHGHGYVGLIAALLGAFHPESRIRVVNRGISGNTVRELQTRWKADVLDLNPDWVSIMVGINDVARQFSRPLQTEHHVGIEEYRSTLDALLSSLAGRVKGVICLSPYMIEPNRNDIMRARMDEYALAMSNLARAHGAIFVDVQAAFDAMTEHMHPNALSADRIHPHRAGHMVIARCFLDAIGFDWQ